MKRIYINLIAMIILGSISLTGCAGGTEDGDIETGESTSSTETETVTSIATIPDTGPLDEVTLKFVTRSYVTNDEKPDIGIVMDEIERRTKDSLNIKIDFSIKPYVEYFTYLFEQSGEDVDTAIMFQASYYYNESFSGYYQKCKFKDITELFPKYAPNLYKEFTKKDLEPFLFDDRLYCIPQCYPNFNASYAIVRKDLMEKYSIPPIRTVDDYELYMKIIKENEKHIIPGRILDESMYLFSKVYDYEILSTRNRLVYKSDNTIPEIIDWYAVPEFDKVLDYYYRWNTNGYITGNKPITSWFRSTKSDMVLGMLASCIINPRTLGEISVETAVSEANGLIKMSYPDRELEIYQLYPEKKIQRLNSIGEHFIAIRPSSGLILFNEKSENIERSLMFLDWIYKSQENYDLFMYGIEGEHYEAVGNDRYKFPDIKMHSDNEYMGWPGSSVFRSIKYERQYFTAPDGLREKYSNFFENNIYYPQLWSLNLFYSKSRNKLAQIPNYLSRALQNLEDDINMGVYAPEDLDFIREELSENVRRNAIKSLQKAVDEYLDHK